ncbi:MAG: acyl-CoA dehydrogenase family protein [Chloroflexi bacterium]|nr:acyl-CoA dehydrogenase family protein [Chloroflexota bacterium]
MTATTAGTTEVGGFELELSEEQALVQRTAREFATTRVLPLAAAIDRDAAIPKELLRELASLGFMGVCAPQEWGGSGLDAVSLVLALEEIFRACASTGVVMTVNNSLVCDPLLRYGSDAQKERFLKPLAKGELLGCFALSEPAAGSDAAAMRTTATRDGAGWVLNGTKNFITNGASADVAIVFAQTDAEKKHKGIAAFVVDKHGAGITVGKKEHKLGIRGSDTTQLAFDGCRVGADALLGEVGQGFRIALSTLDGGRIGIAAQAVGIARACLEDSVAYAKEREAFGQKIADLQAIQWKLADMATETDAARLLTWRAAALKASGAPYEAEAAMAKLFASDVAVRASRECVQVFGGYGYLADFPAERHYRDAKITELYEGTSEIMKLVIADDLFGKDRA